MTDGRRTPMLNRGLGTWLETRRLGSPDSIALIHGEADRISYRELAGNAERVAALLTREGIGRGDRVGYLGENQPSLVETLFGCVLVGAVFVPLNTRLAPPELGLILDDAGARLLIHDARLADIAAAATGGRVPTIVAGEEPAVAGVPAPSPVALGEDDPAALLYTSGTTGRPKGAILTHGNLTWNCINVLVDVDVASTDIALIISPLFHAAALGMGLLPILLKGGTAILERSFDAGRALQLIERHGVTMLSGVPTTFQFIAEHPQWATTDVGSLRKLTCGGSPVPTRVLEAYEARGLSFSQGYGMTETSPGATFLPPSMSRAKMGSAGISHFFTSVRVVDADGEEVAPGTIGEIQIAGPNVTIGYHEDRVATAAAFTDDGWFRSGDVGYFDDDGYLFVSDRLKDMIISGGENIYPAEVEDLILDLDDVTGVAVIGVPDQRWGERPWAVITVRTGANVSADQISAHLAGRIARYKIPKNVVIVDQLPRTASGKVRKVDLRAQIEAGALTEN
jgi:fatty-acyl-CoA synthase